MAKRGFTIHHNGPKANCLGQPHTRCVAFWNAVKNYHVRSRGWSDIAYSFGVCPHGIRFTGRGWHKNQFANGTDVVGEYDGKDSEWYTVLVFLGEDEKPTPEMVEGVKALIRDGRSLGLCGMRVLPHNAFKRKACPGPEFTAYARQWDNAPLDAPQDTPIYTDTEDDTTVVIGNNFNHWRLWFTPQGAFAAGMPAGVPLAKPSVVLNRNQWDALVKRLEADKALTRL